jgi:hypothetical protein
MFEDYNESVFKNIKDDNIKAYETRLKGLIEHLARRIEYAESRRNGLLLIGGAILAAGVAVFVNLDKTIAYLPLYYMLGIFSICGIMIGVLVWYLYSKQVNYKYPFTQVSNSWKWFYRDSLENHKAFNVPWHMFQRKKKYENIKREYEKQATQFLQNQLDLVDTKKSILEDLKQLYLLHVNEKYKNLFLTHLRNVIKYGLLVTMIISTMGFVYGLYIQYNKGNVYSNITYEQGVIVKTEWSKVDKFYSEEFKLDIVEIHVKMNTVNKSNQEYHFNTLSIFADDDSALPLLKQDVVNQSYSLKCDSSLILVGNIQVPDGSFNKLRGFYLK